MKENIQYSGIKISVQFVRNIYSKEELSKSPQISTLENYYETYQNFIKICLALQSVIISHVNFDDVEDECGLHLKEFLEEKCSNTDLENVRSEIENMETKNIMKDAPTKILKFYLKLYKSVYDRLIDFPKADFMYDTVTTNHFFRKVYRLIKVKVHLHHSDITGKILGYVHDFCNLKVRENKTETVMIVHSLFGFDMFFFIKGFQATAWNTKNINLGRTNLTHSNFANIGGKIKLLDTLKYYQKSLAQLTSPLSDKEKIEVKKVAEQFFNQRNYFSGVWRYLSPQQKEKLLNIIAEGKGIFPYEKIVDANSMFITPENNVFFEKK